MPCRVLLCETLDSLLQRLLLQQLLVECTCVVRKAPATTTNYNYSAAPFTQFTDLQPLVVQPTTWLLVIHNSHSSRQIQGSTKHRQAVLTLEGKAIPHNLTALLINDSESFVTLPCGVIFQSNSSLFTKCFFACRMHFLHVNWIPEIDTF